MATDDPDDSSAGPFDALRDIGRILAEALRDHPFIAALVLLDLIAAIVTIAFAGSEALTPFFLLTAFAVIAPVILFMIEVRSQRARIRRPSGHGEAMAEGTFSLHTNQLGERQRENISTALRGAASDAASALKMDSALVRSNIFGLHDNGQLQILPGMIFNMNRPQELTLSIPVGYGSSGRCYQKGKPNIAVFHEDWGKNVIEDRELTKAHPDLRWIVSLPIPAPGGGTPLGVLNVDGLTERKNEDELRGVLSRLFRWSQIVSLIVLEGDPGDRK